MPGQARHDKSDLEEEFNTDIEAGCVAADITATHNQLGPNIKHVRNYEVVCTEPDIDLLVAVIIGTCFMIAFFPFASLR